MSVRINGSQNQISGLRSVRRPDAAVSLDVEQQLQLAEWRRLVSYQPITEALKAHYCRQQEHAAVLLHYCKYALLL